jgi:hypothetical protein
LLAYLPDPLKKLVPRRVRRFLLLHVFHANRRYANLLREPPRTYMESEILPWVRQHCSSVLFVGTAPYTYHYEQGFRRGQYTTIDVHPSTAAWGARAHIVSPIQEVDRHRARGSFDCVIMTGVFGFGVDKFDDMQATLRAVHQVLRPGGLLVLGWNTDKHLDPEALGLLASGFEAANQPPFPNRLPYGFPQTLVYDFYRRRPDA